MENTAGMLKRGFDLLFATLGLIVFAPLMAVIALLVRCTSPGPVLFRQRRVGRGFREFEILKFRTMAADAPQRGSQITAGRDPRITRIGHILRRTKLDELPQLVNVWRGDMSFVGPRPEVPKYVSLFQGDYEQLLTVRPGITDLASLKYRHESDLLGQADDPERMYVEQILPDKIALAKEYIRRSSLPLDVLLIFKTLFRVAA